ncbi:MAG: ATP-binding protein [Acidimicrobiaceae bacterium]|nr:ATP-binding protein [Acidimicrobiaceae bacterium]
MPPVPVQGFVPRQIEPVLRKALETFRIVVLSGPRQSGKTTLARQIAPGGRPVTLDGRPVTLGGRPVTLGQSFLSLDEPTMAALAREDPTGFVSGRTRPTVIDEVQRGGDDLVRAIKLAVDADPAPGQFLLTSSAGFLHVPVLSESLAGRAVFFELAPLSEVEICGRPGGLLTRLLSNAQESLEHLTAASYAPLDRSHYAERVCRGGYPEVTDLSEADRQLWFQSYVHTLVTRDIVELTGARRSSELPRLLRAVAARTAGELVMQDLHRDMGFGSIETTADYLAYLEMTHLVCRLDGWAASAPTRAKRRSKVHVTDSGLAAAMLGVTSESLSDPATRERGQLHESFVFAELRRQAQAVAPDLRFCHYRDSRKREIDLLIERPDGRLIAVEVKAAATVRPDDGKSLAWLRDLIGERFETGIVLYTGWHPHRLSDRIAALPLSCLWDA